MGQELNHNAPVASKQWGDDRADTFASYISDRKRSDDELFNQKDAYAEAPLSDKAYFEALKTAEQRSEEFNDAAISYLLMKESAKKHSLTEVRWPSGHKSYVPTDKVGKLLELQRKLSKADRPSGGIIYTGSSTVKTADFEDEHGTGGPPLSDRKFKALLPEKHPAVQASKGNEKVAVMGAVRGLSPAWKSALQSGVGWGAGTGAISAALAPSGERGKAALKGFGAGMLGGAIVPLAERGAMRLMQQPAASVPRAMAKMAESPIPVEQIKERAAEKYPQEEVPTLGEEVGGVWDALKKKWRDIKKTRAEAIGVEKIPKPKFTPPLPKTPLTKEASIQSALRQVIPKGITDPGALTLAGAGAALLGLSTYMSSKPREDLGGKSKAEVAFEGDVRARKARGGEDYPSGIGAHMTEFKHGLSKEMRKHPGAAAATGAAVGGGLGLSLARILGALKK